MGYLQMAAQQSTKANGFKHRRLDIVTDLPASLCDTPPESTTQEWRIPCHNLEVLGAWVEARASWLFLFQ